MDTARHLFISAAFVIARHHGQSRVRSRSFARRARAFFRSFAVAGRDRRSGDAPISSSTLAPALIERVREICSTRLDDRAARAASRANMTSARVCELGSARGSVMVMVVGDVVQDYVG
jgi:hypothetical protein